MLITNLFEFKNIKNTDNILTCQVEINPLNDIYKGHFPNNPITPGVMQVQLVTDILEQHFDKDLTLSTMDRCKFLAILNPKESPVIDVEITITESESGIKIKALGKDINATYFKFSALYI